MQGWWYVTWYRESWGQGFSPGVLTCRRNESWQPLAVKRQRSSCVWTYRQWLCFPVLGYLSCVMFWVVLNLRGARAPWCTALGDQSIPVWVGGTSGVVHLGEQRWWPCFLSRLPSLRRNVYVPLKLLFSLSTSDFFSRPTSCHPSGLLLLSFLC